MFSQAGSKVRGKPQRPKVECHKPKEDIFNQQRNSIQNMWTIQKPVRRPIVQWGEMGKRKEWEIGRRKSWNIWKSH